MALMGLQLTNQIQKVRCPTCGAAEGRSANLERANLVPKAHLDRRLNAEEKGNA